MGEIIVVPVNLHTDTQWHEALTNRRVKSDDLACAHDKKRKSVKGNGYFKSCERLREFGSDFKRVLSQG